jgi:hypothetical protein
MAKKSNLDRHLKLCKIKNGGMDILADKVRQEQIIKEKDAKIKERDELLKQKDAEIELLKKMVVNVQPQQVNNITNNITNNIQINVNVYNNPDTSTLRISMEDIKKFDKLSKMLLQKIYFNEDIPQNHCLYFKTKDKVLVIFDDGEWRAVVGKNIDAVIENLSNVILEKGTLAISGKDAPGHDNNFELLPPPLQEKIIAFNTYSDMLSKDDAIGIFTAGSQVVKNTIKAAGCTFVR